MSSEVEESAALPADPAWYSKIFECVRNRNRIGPGKVELPECDFFIVGPRRTLRVLLPTPKGTGYYEPSSTERPETIDENFVSRWAMRPHPSGNCRCSFRQSRSRPSTREDRLISAELNRIRTSLSEAERSGEDIEVLERRISLKLDGLGAEGEVVVGDPTRSEVDEKLAEIANVGPPLASKRDDDMAIKRKIVKDLERYIEVLLQEVLSDTMKFFSDAGDTLRRSRAALSSGKDCGSVCFDPSHLGSCGSPAEVKEVEEVEEVKEAKIPREATGEEAEVRRLAEGARKSFEISFAFHGQEAHARDQNGGYVNRAFSGSNNDPDSLDFDLRKPVSEEIGLENLDCVDSGINSVETIEFQTSEEPSLEQSLMEIIDAKFGPAKGGWKDSGVKTGPDSPAVEIGDVGREAEKEAPCNGEETILGGKTDQEARFKVVEPIEPLKSSLGDSALRRLEESAEELNDISDQPSFDKLRLELLETGSEEKRTSAVTSLREKFARKFGCGNREVRDEEKLAEKTKDEESPPSPVELRVKSDKIWHEIREPADPAGEENHTEFVKVRRSKKPTIVFLHGFGSSAEIFEHQLEYFSNLGYPCVAPEMLGHGMSSAPDRSRDYHFDKLLRDLDMILQHYAFGAGRKCVLVAHNYGCSFATALACKYDSNIHQLVLISGGGPTPLAPPSTEGAGHCCLRAMLTPLLMCGLHRDILYSARGRQHPYCGSEPPEQWPSHMKYVLDGMVWPEGDYVFHRRISTPTLLIHGLRDNKVSLVQECQMERTIIKGFLDAIPTAGHTPMTDCPEQVNHMIHCFIDLWKRKKR